MIELEEQRKIINEIKKQDDVKKLLRINKILGIVSVLVLLLYLIAVVCAALVMRKNHDGLNFIEALLTCARFSFFIWVIVEFAIYIPIMIIGRKAKTIINERVRMAVLEESKEIEEQPASVLRGEVADSGVKNATNGGATATVQTTVSNAAAIKATKELDKEKEVRTWSSAVKRYYVFEIIIQITLIAAFLCMMLPIVSLYFYLPSLTGEGIKVYSSINLVKADVSIARSIFDPNFSDSYVEFFELVIDGSKNPTALKTLATLHGVLVVFFPVSSLFKIVITIIKITKAEDTIRRGNTKIAQVTFNSRNKVVSWSARGVIAAQIIGGVIMLAMIGGLHCYYVWLYQKSGCAINWLWYSVPLLLLVASVAISTWYSICYRKDWSFVKRYTELNRKRIDK